MTTEVVHIHGIWNPWWAVAAFILSLRAVPYVVSPHGSLEPEALRYKRWKKKAALILYQRAVLKLAGLLVVTSEKEAEGVRALGFNRNKIRVVPNGIFLSGSDDGVTHFDRSNKHVPLSNELSIFLYLSRIHPIKGLPMLVKAWAKVRRSDWRFVIAGHDEIGHLEEVKALAENLGVLSDFEFLGQVHGPSKRLLFDNADVFVLPTHSENFGVVIAEALSHGLPVITTRGAPWSVLPSRGCGWWCDINPDAIALALKEAMNLSWKARKGMGARGRQLIADSFDLNVIAQEAIKNVYLPLAKTRH